MRHVFGVLLLAGSVTAVSAQDAPPDLTGVWSGQWKTVIFGTNAHHPGSETAANPPRVIDITFHVEFEGQDGRVIWGHTWSDPAAKEPFAATFTADGSIIGSDLDGSLHISVVSPEQLDACYMHPGLSPSGSVVASCGILERTN